MMLVLLLLLLLHDLLMLVPAHLLITDPLGTPTTILLPVPVLICVRSSPVITIVAFTPWSLVSSLTLEGFSIFLGFLPRCIELSGIEIDTGVWYTPVGECFQHLS